MRKLIGIGCFTLILVIAAYITIFVMIGKAVDKTIDNSLKPDTTITVINGKADTTIIIKSKPWYAQ